MTRPGNVVLAVCCVALAVGITPSGELRADKASAALAKYAKPVDKAIDKALAYLAARQNKKEGYWPSPMGKSTAVTSLAVMAFLSKGYTPGTGPHGEVINAGIDFILRSQKPNGVYCNRGEAGPMYSHCITTLMLSEVSGMVDAKRQKKIDEALPKAVRLILTAQQVRKAPVHQGGWRYHVRSADSDISCTGWALMALRSARNNGTAIPKKAIDDAVKFVLRCRSKARPPKPKPGSKKLPPGVGFGYQPGGGPGLARTGTAVLCLELCGHHRSKESLEGGDWILANPQKRYGALYFYYALYYCSQGMFQLGGRHWERFAPHMYEMMLKFQRKDGSWPQGSSGESRGGPCYSTAMGVLAIAVTYRQLPIYQR